MSIPVPTADSLSASVSEFMDRAHNDLATLVSFPSVHIDSSKSDASRASAEWVCEAFTDLGFDAEVIVTSDGSPAVVGHRAGPAGSPTVALYSHHDVQPAGDDALWTDDPFTLTERDGRWYGRGSADCKGNVVAHLTALRAAAEDLSCNVRIIIEGSEEAGGEGLDDLVKERPELFAADLILIGDAGNVAVGLPTLTTSLRGVVNVKVTVSALETAVHSGAAGGPTPDAMAALVAGLASLRDDRGDTVIEGVENTQEWGGVVYSDEQFRADVGALEGTAILGSGTPADMAWARPAVTVIGMDAPSTAECAAAIIPQASAMLNLRIPPGMEPQPAYDALVAHLRKHIPWGVRVDVEPDAFGRPFRAKVDGPGYAALTEALKSAYGVDGVFHAGQGGSIPLCTVLAEAHPNAEIALLGVEEPLCHIHAPNESVDPEEIRRTALAEAIVLTSFGS
ncbi:dipeptidase [Gordonia humi]|uniref:Acetylornithine deacetylase/succinyl-diaminopimelate desuccinylase-like protein n=1 Tax=Gordonia humi TaxID=686429 RepID=A0A840F211_9ACTN|nr:dipeptidase [Gordonia humi]MBB4135429.1 acetylornithine deacetylase/succinyl-diaminopimelate desuccinylase-like protein [Gordonia humi]